MATIKLEREDSVEIEPADVAVDVATISGWVTTPAGSKARSVVWAHINIVEEGVKAECIHCKSDFSIKGGTSAILRHLKSMHPQQIDYDPSVLPVKRGRKKLVEGGAEVSDETKNYVDALLKQFTVDVIETDELSLESTDQPDVSPSHSGAMVVEEAIRVLKNDGEVDAAPVGDVDIRRFFGFDEDCERTASSPTSPGFDEIVPSVTMGSTRKRRANDNVATVSDKSMRLGSLNISPPAISSEDDELRELTKLQIKATINREKAMTRYYQMKADKIELEIEAMRASLN